MASKMVIKNYTDKNYAVYGEEFLQYAIAGCRKYPAGIIEKDTKTKKPGFTIPVDKIQQFLAQLSSMGVEFESSFTKSSAAVVPENEEEKKESAAQKEQDDQDIIDAFNVEKIIEKKKNKIKQITPIKVINSDGEFYKLEILGVGNVRFNVYHSKKRILIFYNKFLAVVHFLTEFTHEESITVRESKDINFESFLDEFILKLRNFDIQPYNYSQSEINGLKFCYFYIYKYQDRIKKRSFVNNFLEGIYFDSFETDFFLGLGI